jgi:hypothetical protein
VTPQSVRYDDEFESRSGRRWRCISKVPDSYHTVTLMPLGSDTYGSGGGVKCRRVERRRLEDQTHGWGRA